MPHHARFKIDQCISDFQLLETNQIKAHHKLRYTENLIRENQVSTSTFNCIHKTLLAQGHKHISNSETFDSKVEIISKITAGLLTQIIHNTNDNEHCSLTHKIHTITEEVGNILKTEPIEAKELAFAYFSNRTHTIQKSLRKKSEVGRNAKKMQGEPHTNLGSPNALDLLLEHLPPTSYPFVTQLHKGLNKQHEPEPTNIHNAPQKMTH
jgi:hypothetical protein